MNEVEECQKQKRKEERQNSKEWT